MNLFKVDNISSINIINDIYNLIIKKTFFTYNKNYNHLILKIMNSNYKFRICGYTSDFNLILTEENFDIDSNFLVKFYVQNLSTGNKFNIELIDNIKDEDSIKSISDLRDENLKFINLKLNTYKELALNTINDLDEKIKNYFQSNYYVIKFAENVYEFENETIIFKNEHLITELRTLFESKTHTHKIIFKSEHGCILFSSPIKNSYKIYYSFEALPVIYKPKLEPVVIKPRIERLLEYINTFDSKTINMNNNKDNYLYLLDVLMT